MICYSILTFNSKFKESDVLYIGSMEKKVVLHYVSYTANNKGIHKGSMIK